MFNYFALDLELCGAKVKDSHKHY